MIREQFILDLHGELIVDNFAGGGGASTGIEMALGRCVDIAINHDPEAVALHEANHPQTRHYVEDVFAVDPVEVCKGRPVGLAWFSPDCTHHSKARGGKPRSKKIRGLAWVAVKWAATVRPRVIILENVEEFQTWGPLLPDGQPCPARKGQTFRSFIGQLERLGYRVEWRELRACDYGAPTIRKRLFLIARCDGSPIAWPEPTHGDPVTAQQRGLKQWRTAAECIDWTIPCPSIFERKRPLAEATCRRIAKGIMRYVVNAADPFIVPLTHHGSVRVESIHEPFRTVTGAHRGEKALVVPYIQHIQHGSSSGGVMPADEPMRTVTATPKGGGMALVAPQIINVANSKTTGRGPNAWSPEEPLRTVTASPGFAIAAAHLSKYYGEKSPNEVRGVDLNEPLHTQSTENRFALVSAFLAKHYTGVVGTDLRQPTPTVTSVDHNALVAASMVKMRGSNVGDRADAPLHTISAGGTHHALVAAHIQRDYGQSVGHDVRDPMGTVTAGGGGHAALVRAFLVKYYGNEKEGVSLREPMHTVTAKDRMGLVTVAGEDWQIWDIGMRMLAPRELYRAQGFPDSYLIDIPYNGKPLTKTAQVRMCGNSVCPPLAKALVAANVPEMAVWFKGERKVA